MEGDGEEDSWTDVETRVSGVQVGLFRLLRTLTLCKFFYMMCLCNLCVVHSTPSYTNYQKILKFLHIAHSEPYIITCSMMQYI